MYISVIEALQSSTPCRLNFKSYFTSQGPEQSQPVPYTGQPTFGSIQPTPTIGTNPPSVAMETLRVDLREVTSQRDAALSDLRERDARIQRLLAELQGLVILLGFEPCVVCYRVCSLFVIVVKMKPIKFL